MMRKPEKALTRLLALLICLPVVFCATLALLGMARSEEVDAAAYDEVVIPEDPTTYDGLVILEDPALIGSLDDVEPSASPTNIPTSGPTQAPTLEPTAEPTQAVTEEPTAGPSQAPTVEPSADPTQAPTPEPSTPATEPPAAASYTIAMAAPSGWYKSRAVMEVTVTDEGGTGWQNIRVVVTTSDGVRTVIDGPLASGHLWLDLLDNGAVEVVVTDPYGQEHAQHTDIQCFDHDPPLLKASVRGEYLHIEANDAKSGIGSVQVNGTHYRELTDGKLQIHLREYADAYEQLLVQAVDAVGNTSRAIAVANPFFHNAPTALPTATPTAAPVLTPEPTATPRPTRKPTSSATSGDPSDPVTPTPSAEPTLLPTQAPTATPIQAEAGEPFAQEGNAFTRDLLYDQATNKQFIAIETRSGDVFYVIIDYDKPLDEAGEQYETYFLNLVDNRDLLDIVDDADIPAEPEIVYMTPEPTQAPTPSPAPVAQQAPEQEENSGTTLGMIGLVMVAGSGAVWYFKLRKPSGSKRKPSTNDYAFDDEDEDMEGEDSEDQ